MITEILLIIISFIGGFFVFKLKDMKEEISKEKRNTERVRDDALKSKEVSNEVDKMSDTDIDDYFASNWLRKQHKDKEESP